MQMNDVSRLSTSYLSLAYSAQECHGSLAGKSLIRILQLPIITLDNSLRGKSCSTCCLPAMHFHEIWPST